MMNAVRWERAVLGSVLMGEEWDQVRPLALEDFLLTDHKKIFAAMSQLSAAGMQADLTALVAELGEESSAFAIVCDLTGDVQIGTNTPQYVKELKQAAAALECNRLYERLLQAASTEEKRALVRRMDAILSQGAPSVAVVRLLSDVEAKDVDWLWEPYIPKGMLSILTGDPGVGKSFIALRITADVARRGGKVVYLTIENSASYTLRPRFDALQGDASQLILLEGVSTQGTVRSVTLQDIEVLDKTLAEHKPELVVIDPIQSYLGAGVDAHRSNETRPIMDGLAKLAEKHHVAVLILRHASKNGSGRAIYRGLGSIDFTGAVRCELFAGETLEKQRAVCHIKSNIGPIGSAQGYEITPADDQGRIWSAGYFRWTGDTEIGIGDLTEPEEATVGRADEAENFLRDMLSDGPKPAKTVIKEARDAGIAERTLERAKAKLKVESRKGMNGWEWVLPPEKEPRPPNTRVGGLESVDTPKQHTINNLGNIAKTAKSATLEGVGGLDGSGRGSVVSSVGSRPYIQRMIPG
jgi:hypothetical protein